MTLRATLALSAALLALPALAQEAPEAPATEAPATGAPAEGAPVGGDLSMGEDAAPREGEPYTRETFGDWSLRCLRSTDGPEPCQLYQLLLGPEGNPVAEVSMFPLPPGTSGEAVAGATIVVPLETLLTADLTLSVDGGATRRYPFTFCNAAGCVARVGFTEAEVDQFRAGSAAQISIVPAAAPDQTVALDLSLMGFTAGFASQAVAAPAE